MRTTIIGIIAILVAILLCLAAFIMLPRVMGDPEAPSDSATLPTAAPTEPTAPDAEVRLYQCDPELAQDWQALAQRYTQETGIKVTVITPENGYRDDVLRQHLQGSNAPTVFCLHHSHELDVWKDHCLDLSGSAIADALQQDIFALKEGTSIFGVAANVESYGIIYNSKLLARAGYTASDITDYASLKNIIEYITANKKSLGFSAFASPDLSDTAHGSLLCLLAGLSDDPAVLRDFWDLYRNNCVRSGAALTDSDSSDSLNDFLKGKAVFYLGGTWDYEDLTGIEDYFLNILPVYTSESTQNLGLHHAVTGYWCVNSGASAQDRAASLDFLAWLVTAQEDAPAPVDALGLLTPYKDTQHAGNPLEQLVLESMGNDNSVQWNSCDELTPELLEQFGQALGDYTKKPGDTAWDKVTALKKEEE